MNYFTLLDPNCCHNIFAQVPVREIRKVSLVCQQFNKDLSGRNGLTGFRAFVEARGTTHTVRCAEKGTGRKWATLVNLKELYLWNNQIADLTPLSALVHLKALGLSNNQIADLTPLSALVKLKTLNLDNNQIADLNPLSALVNLKVLWLRDNQIADQAGAGAVRCICPRLILFP